MCTNIIPDLYWLATVGLYQLLTYLYIPATTQHLILHTNQIPDTAFVNRDGN